MTSDPGTEDFELLAVKLGEIAGSGWDDPRVLALEAQIKVVWRRNGVAYPSPPSLWPNWKGMAGASEHVRQAVFGVLVSQAQAQVRAAGDLVRATGGSRGPKIEA